jgi:hypothetical protein
MRPIAMTVLQSSLAVRTKLATKYLDSARTGLMFVIKIRRSYVSYHYYRNTPLFWCTLEAWLGSEAIHASTYSYTSDIVPWLHGYIM